MLLVGKQSQVGYCPVCGEPAGRLAEPGDSVCVFGHRVESGALLSEEQVFELWCAAAIEE